MDVFEFKRLYQVVPIKIAWYHFEESVPGPCNFPLKLPKTKTHV